MYPGWGFDHSDQCSPTALPPYCPWMWAAHFYFLFPSQRHHLHSPPAPTLPFFRSQHTDLISSHGFLVFSAFSTYTGPFVRRGLTTGYTAVPPWTCVVRVVRGARSWAWWAWWAWCACVGKSRGVRKVPRAAASVPPSVYPTGRYPKVTQLPCR